MKQWLFSSACLLMGVLGACTHNPTATAPSAPFLPTAEDSLSISVANVDLLQRLYSTIPCISEGWVTEITLIITNRHQRGVLEGIQFWSAIVIVSDTVAFAMNLSTTWNGSVTASTQDTVLFTSSISRPCQDTNHAGQFVSMRIPWLSPTHERRYLEVDSVKVSYISLPY